MMTNSISEKVNRYFESDKKVSRESLEILTWFIYQLEENRQHDLWLMAKILPEQNLSNLVSYFSGENVRFPTKDQYIELRLLSVCFFLKEIQGWDWDKIRSFLGIGPKEESVFNSFSLGHRINQIKEYLLIDIKNVMKKCEINDDFFTLKSYIEEAKKKDKELGKKNVRKRKRK